MSISLILLRVYHLLLILTLIIGWRRRYTRSNKILVGLLTTSILVESYVYLANYVFQHSYVWAYTIYLPIEHIFLMLYLRHITKMDKHKIASIGIGVYLIITFIYWFIQGGVDMFPTTLYNLHGLIIIGYSLFALFNINPRTEVPITKQPYFWFLTGFILFYSSSFTINVLHEHIIQMDNENLSKFRMIFMKIVNFILYISMIIGFLCTKPSNQE